jgi:hypothetical protein
MFRRVTPLAALLVLSACDVGVDSGPVTFSWHGPLEAAPGWEQLSGEGALSWTEGNAEFQAAAVVLNDEPGAERPWHVHHGTCDTGGSIVGAAEAYPPVVVEADGEGVALATVPGTLDRAASYHINIHASADQLETVIGCVRLGRI